MISFIKRVVCASRSLIICPINLATRSGRDFITCYVPLLRASNYSTRGGKEEEGKERLMPRMDPSVCHCQEPHSTRPTISHLHLLYYQCQKDDLERNSKLGQSLSPEPPFLQLYQPTRKDCLTLLSGST